MRPDERENCHLICNSGFLWLFKPFFQSRCLCSVECSCKLWRRGLNVYRRNGIIAHCKVLSQQSPWANKQDHERSFRRAGLRAKFPAWYHSPMAFSESRYRLYWLMNGGSGPASIECIRKLADQKVWEETEQARRRELRLHKPCIVIEQGTEWE